jgi:CubicO group peptidase (beta-lactamase class C family)
MFAMLDRLHSVASTNSRLVPGWWIACCIVAGVQALGLSQEKPPAAPVAPVAPVDPAQALRHLEPYIQQSLERWQVPGAAVAVVHRGQTVLCQGYGVRRLGSQESVDAQTLFAIASNTKAFTTAALAILVEQGKLRWDDRVRTHLPDFELYDEYVTHEMRVRDLVCHRSGLGTFSGDLLWYGTPFSPAEILKRASHLEPQGPFRAHYGYSNVMFLAAGLVIEKASGQSWAGFVRERILKPLGMERTVLSVRELLEKENFATPHKTLLDTSEPIAWVNWDSMAAAGGIISSADDMAKWMQLQLKRGALNESVRLFSEASSHEMWQSQTSIPVSANASRRIPSTHFRGYGLGWALSDYQGRKLVSHGGGYDGMFSQVMLVPEEELGIVVLTNSMTSFPDSIVFKGVDLFLGAPERDWTQENLESFRRSRTAFRKRIDDAIVCMVQPGAKGSSPNHALADYVGMFRCPLMDQAQVSLEQDHLVLRLKANPQLVADLKHLHYDTFVIQWRNRFAWFEEGTAHFVADAKGRLVELKLHVPNDDLWFHELKFKRVE